MTPPTTWFGTISWTPRNVFLNSEDIPLDSDIADVACTHLHVAILMKDGKLAIRRVDEEDGIPRILDSEESTILVTTSTSIFLCNQKGILKVMEEGEEKKRIPFPWPVKIVEAVGGHDHVIFRDSQGNLFSMGTGTRGELGVGLVRRIDEPVHIEQLAGIRISKVSCGGWHTVVLTEAGDAYTWGWNRYGQLGKNKASTEVYPVLIDPAEEFSVSEEDIDDVTTTEHTTTVTIGHAHFVMGSDDERINEFELK
uniref:RCC1 domain-containing protein 1 n=1 Tax=Caenorhabditis tropicalis TaxID=1561998 RepID=A0A1I7T4Q7_9PELO